MQQEFSARIQRHFLLFSNYIPIQHAHVPNSAATTPPPLGRNRRSRPSSMGQQAVEASESLFSKVKSAGPGLARTLPRLVTERHLPQQAIEASEKLLSKAKQSGNQLAAKIKQSAPQIAENVQDFVSERHLQWAKNPKEDPRRKEAPGTPPPSVTKAWSACHSQQVRTQISSFPVSFMEQLCPRQHTIFHGFNRWTSIVDLAYPIDPFSSHQHLLNPQRCLLTPPLKRHNST